MRLLALVTAFGLFGVSAPALATHGNPIPQIANDRAQETCIDLKAGAPLAWSVKKNLQVGLLQLSQISGGDVDKTTAKIYSEKYAEQVKNKCKEAIDERKPESNNQESHSQVI